jgi:hypothetical protein
MTTKKEIVDFVRVRLGGGMVDVELDPAHYEVALTTAIDRYRQRSSNSVEESYAFLQIQPEQTEYIMPKECVNVRSLYRRGIGTTTPNSTVFDPFQTAFINTYLINTGRMGGLATYEMFSQYQELSARMFGVYLNFSFNPQNKKLIIMRKFNTQENVLVWQYNHRPDASLLMDQYAFPWLRDYTLAVCKQMLGEAREKFGSIAGPGGGTTLNGTALKAEALAEMTRLEDELKNYVDNGTPYSFIIG